MCIAYGSNNWLKMWYKIINDSTNRETCHAEIKQCNYSKISLKSKKNTEVWCNIWSQI